MKEVSLQDIADALKRRENERLVNPPISSPKKLPPKKSYIEYNLSSIDLQTFLRLWNIRNKETFSLKDLSIFPNDNNNSNLYYRLQHLVKCGFVEKLSKREYLLTKDTREELEGILSFMKEHQ